MLSCKPSLQLGAALLLASATLVRAQSASSVDASTVADGVFRASSMQGLQEAYLPIFSPSSHAANLITLQNGDTLCFWFSGTKEGASGVSIVMSRLPKGARQWQKTVLVHREDGRSYQNPVIFQDRKGELWLFHASQAANQGETNAHVLLLKSIDNGQTWTGPKILFPFPGSFTRQPLVVTDTGKWLLPIFYVPPGDPLKTNYSAVEVSDDEGGSWHECVVPKTTTGLVQPNIIQLAHDSFIMFMRSRHADWIYQSTSTDGCHWTDPAPTPLPNNNASIQAVRLKDGALAITFDNTNAAVIDGPAPRSPLSIALSVNGGKSWRWTRDLEVAPKTFKQANAEFSYPTIIQEPGGTVMVAYTYNRETIKIIELDESWIKQGSTIGKFQPSGK